MVFEDLTAQKQLDEERRRADRLDFLNRVVGHIAHEIKNPLVSIKTFIELLDERYDDPEFRSYFANVVKHDVKAIDNITEILVDFSRKTPYRFEYGDVNTTTKNCILSLMSSSRYFMKHHLEDYREQQSFKPDISNIVFTPNENLPLVRLDEGKRRKTSSIFASI